MTSIEELFNTISVFMEFKENNYSTSPTINNKSPDQLKNENNNRQFNSNSTSNEGKSSLCNDENKLKKTSNLSNAMFKHSNQLSNTNFNNNSYHNTQFKKRNKLRNYYPINNFDYNSVTSNNGKLITLNECKVKEESDDGDEEAENDIMRSVPKTLPNAILNRNKKDDRGNFIYFPDEIEGTVFYEAIETHNLNTKPSVLNPITPHNENNSLEHVSLTFENNINEEKCTNKIINDIQDISTIKNTSSNLNTYKEKESTELNPSTLTTSNVSYIHEI
jgi:hypothetical protein